MVSERSIGFSREPAGLVSVDDTIDETAAKALQAAKEAEENARLKKAALGGKVRNPPSSPQTRPTPEKKSR